MNKIECFRLCIDNAPEWFLTSDKITVISSSTCVIDNSVMGKITAHFGDYIIKIPNGEIFKLYPTPEVEQIIKNIISFCEECKLEK